MQMAWCVCVNVNYAAAKARFSHIAFCSFAHKETFAFYGEV
jgi:hypothetical protein